MSTLEQFRLAENESKRRSGRTQWLFLQARITGFRKYHWGQIPLRAFIPGLLLVSTLVAGCSSRSEQVTTVQQQLDAHADVLYELPKSYYRPGLGDLMHAAQLRHAKLWFAGTGGAWELAAFETHELEETFERISYWHNQNEEAGAPMSVAVKVHTDRPLSHVAAAIAQQDAHAFETAFDQLTLGCNACHAAADHEFIQIQRPSTPPLTNQRYTPVTPN